MLVRFVVGSAREHHRERTGIVTEARFPRDDGRLSAEEAAQLEESYDWLADLPVQDGPGEGDSPCHPSSGTSSPASCAGSGARTAASLCAALRRLRTGRQRTLPYLFHIGIGLPVSGGSLPMCVSGLRPETTTVFAVVD